MRSFAARSRDLLIVSILSGLAVATGCSKQENIDPDPPDGSTPANDAAAVEDLAKACTPMACTTVQGVVKRKLGVRP